MDWDCDQRGYLPAYLGCHAVRDRCFDAVIAAVDSDVDFYVQTRVSIPVDETWSTMRIWRHRGLDGLG